MGDRRRKNSLTAGASNASVAFTLLDDLYLEALRFCDSQVTYSRSDAGESIGEQGWRPAYRAEIRGQSYVGPSRIPFDPAAFELAVCKANEAPWPDSAALATLQVFGKLIS